jgi:hypothetical protein
MKFDEIKRAYMNLELVKDRLQNILKFLHLGKRDEVYYLLIHDYEEQINEFELIIKRHEYDEDYIKFINNLRQTIDEKYDIPN